MTPAENCFSSISFIEDKKFNFIIVGDGTADLMLASRLSENSNAQVLVVKSRENRKDDPAIMTPGMVVSLYGKPEDLDAWASLGNPGWGFQELEPYYRKVSTIHPPSEETKETWGLDYFDNSAESERGPLQISFGDSYNPLNKAWLETFANLGHRKKNNPVSCRRTGAFIHPAAIDPQTKTRSYAATAYYTPEVSERTNLKILTGAHVEKVLLDKIHDGSAVASGIQLVTNDGRQHDILAREEVILSAGALHSPKILEFSGVGEKSLLESQGIPIVVDNPNVGENLQDHALVSQSFEVNDGVPTGDLLRNPDILNAVVAQYQANGAGPLGSSNICSSYMPLVDGQGTAHEELEELLDQELTGYSEFPARKPQCKILRELLETREESSAQYIMFPAQLNILPNGPTTTAEMLHPSSPDNYFTIMTMLNRPFSRGFCHIQSADPKQKTRYDPRFCSHPLDMEILARHVQFVEKLTATEPMASTIIKKDGQRLPALSASDLETAREIVRQRQISVFHLSGSCAMMPREIGDVVNERLIVHGTRNLRVVDASIFPLEPLGNIQMTVYAVAERAADIIKEDRVRD